MGRGKLELNISTLVIETPEKLNGDWATIDADRIRNWRGVWKADCRS